MSLIDYYASVPQIKNVTLFFFIIQIVTEMRFQHFFFFFFRKKEISFLDKNNNKTI